MAVLTEEMLRGLWKKDKSTRIEVAEGTKITPSAKEFLDKNNIELVIGDSFNTELPEKESNPVTLEKSFPYVFDENGAFFEEIPLMMTTLYANRLVYKDHPRISFRRKLDSFEGEMLYTLGSLSDRGTKEVLQGLQELLYIVQKLKEAERNDVPLKPFTLLDVSLEEIKNRIENPNEKLRKDHFILTGEASLEILSLNRLRLMSRELESEIVCCFRKDKSWEREDLLKTIHDLECGFLFLILQSKNKNKPSRVRNW